MGSGLEIRCAGRSIDPQFLNVSADGSVNYPPDPNILASDLRTCYLALQEVLQVIESKTVSPFKFIDGCEGQQSVTCKKVGSYSSEMKVLIISLVQSYGFEKATIRATAFTVGDAAGEKYFYQAVTIVGFRSGRPVVLEVSDEGVVTFEMIRQALELAKQKGQL